MFNEQEELISSNQNLQENGPINIPKKAPNKKMVILIFFILLFLVVATSAFLIIKNIIKNNNLASKGSPQELITYEAPVISTSTLTGLPVLGTIVENGEGTTLNLSDMAIEYMSFEDFYVAPEKTLALSGRQDYSLPLNVKMDVANYYDLSRKLSLDAVIGDLNDFGFALIDNPWQKEAGDFYSIYTNLESKHIPVLISSDFIIYHYQNTLKQVYKEIEEKVFYNNLWVINKELYLKAKNRYESRLALVGNINDSVLEAARLQASFFATALELLKPGSEQITSGAVSEPGKFLSSEADRFYFLTPAYLREGVMKEVSLIKSAKEISKSPSLIYSRDYKDFAVPQEYARSARLNNLYLTMKWLNSVFPLNYKDKSCPNCLLDKEDWRLTTIAASFIAADFSQSPELKNRWARVYKLISFFNPTRADLNYVFYRDTLKDLFGEEYKIEEIFDDKNSEAPNNLQKFRLALNKLEFSAFLGGIDKQNVDVNYLQGFKVLSHKYSPSDYVINNLTYPAVDTYSGTTTRNITSCNLQAALRRCNGFSLDFINLVYRINNHSYFQENTNYLKYEQAADELALKLDNELAWRTNNYWSTLSYLSSYLNIDKTTQPLFAFSLKWRDKTLRTSVSAWVNGQLPLEKLTINQNSQNSGLTSLSRYTEYSYVEPNLDLINDLLANNDMLEKMFNALQIDREAPSAAQLINELKSDLTLLKNIVTKELSGQTLSDEDNELIVNFATKLKVEPGSPSAKHLVVKPTGTGSALKEDISRLQLLVLIRQENNNKIISVGPVWNYTESRQ